jgi:hypothetical protein
MSRITTAPPARQKKYSTPIDRRLVLLLKMPKGATGGEMGGGRSGGADDSRNGQEARGGRGPSTPLAARLELLVHRGLGL